MKRLIAAITIALAFTSQLRADERVGQAALGAVSGGLVFGPVGLVAGAVVGFTAGPTIARSWRGNRNRPPHHMNAAKRSTQVAAGLPKPRKPAPGEVTPAPGVGGPPAQGLE